MAANTGELYYEAEIHRLKGELLQQAEEGGPDASPESPEACFLKAIVAAHLCSSEHSATCGAPVGDASPAPFPPEKGG
jgi:hypothetical protein